MQVDPVRRIDFGPPKLIGIGRQKVVSLLQALPTAAVLTPAADPPASNRKKAGLGAVVLFEASRRADACDWHETAEFCGLEGLIVVEAIYDPRSANDRCCRHEGHDERNELSWLRPMRQKRVANFI